MISIGECWSFHNPIKLVNLQWMPTLPPFPRNIWNMVQNPYGRPCAKSQLSISFGVDMHSLKQSSIMQFLGHFQLLKVKKGVKWSFNRHLWLEFSRSFHLICHRTPFFLFNVLGGLPPRVRGVQRAFLQFLFQVWKYRSETLSMPKFSFLAQSTWLCSPQ